MEYERRKCVSATLERGEFKAAGLSGNSLNRRDEVWWCGGGQVWRCWPAGEECINSSKGKSVINCVKCCRCCCSLLPEGGEGWEKFRLVVQPVKGRHKTTLNILFWGLPSWLKRMLFYTVCKWPPPFISSAVLLEEISTKPIPPTYSFWTFKPVYTKAFSILDTCHLFRSARTSWNTFVRPPVRPPVRKKNLNHL